MKASLKEAGDASGHEYSKHMAEATSLLQEMLNATKTAQATPTARAVHGAWLDWIGCAGADIAWGCVGWQDLLDVYTAQGIQSTQFDIAMSLKKDPLGSIPPSKQQAQEETKRERLMKERMRRVSPLRRAAEKQERMPPTHTTLLLFPPTLFELPFGGYECF